MAEATISQFMKRTFLLIASIMALAIGPNCQSQNNHLQVGDSPPPLTLESLLQAPRGSEVSWSGLKGKVVVLEFWATWCIPCIRAMPHLNELADSFKDEAVQFIAITDEKESTVAAFLKKRPIHAWIGLNADKSLFSRYNVTGIPYTVIVDQRGKIAAITNPLELTSTHLKDLLTGRQLTLPPPPQRSGFSFRPGTLPGAGEKEQPLFHILIRPSENLDTGWGGSGGKFTFIGSTAMNMICAAYGVSEARTMIKSDLPEGRFDAVVNVPAKQDDSGKTWLRQILESTFDLRIRRETIEMEALVLTVTNPKPEHLTVSSPTSGSSSHSDAAAGRMQSMNMPIRGLVASLEGLLKKPVIDETGLTNRYDWELQWEAKTSDRLDTDALLKAIRNQLGLGIITAKRSVEVIVTDKAK